MKIFGFAFLLAIACAGGAYAAAPAPEPTATPSMQFEAGGNWSNLTGGYGEWHSIYGTGEWREGRRDFYGTFTEATRNGVTDAQYAGGVVFPSSSQTIFEFEGTFSPTHVYLPDNALAGVLDHRLANGWGYQVGENHRTYPTVSADVGSLGADRYFGRYRAAYTFSIVGLSNVAGPAIDQRIGLTRYYGRNGDSNAALVVSGGRDVENVNGTAAVYPTFEVDLAGRHWFGARYGLSYDLYTLRQGLLYHQTGLQIGLRRRS